MSDKPPALPTSHDDHEHYFRAAALVLRTRHASTSRLQIGLGVGYSYARWLQEAMIEEGVLSPPDELGRHAVLLPPPH
jgi:DNA segregation ATPase FtsK/SpoIIIE-like protein